MPTEILKKVLKETYSKFFKATLLDLLLTFIGTVLAAIYRQDISQMNFKIIGFIFFGLTVAHFLINFIKNYFTVRKNLEERDLSFKSHAEELTKEYGKKFEKLFGFEVRTSVFKEKSDALVIASRYNSYRNDDNSTKWEISHNGSIHCKGVIGKAWTTGEIQKGARLLGKDALRKLLLSDVPKDKEDLSKELRRLNMDENELKKRLEMAERKYLFPKLIYALPINLKSGKKLICVVDSDDKNTNFKKDFENEIERFGTEVKRIYDIIDELK